MNVRAPPPHQRQQYQASLEADSLPLGAIIKGWG